MLKYVKRKRQTCAQNQGRGKSGSCSQSAKTALRRLDLLLCRHVSRESLMVWRFGLIAAMLMAWLAASPANAQAGGDVNGTWLTQAGDAKVRVSKCGGGICGVIVWLRDPTDPNTGKPQVDDKNRNPSLAQRPMIGLPLFSGMQPSGPNKWSGQIYNADDGNSYVSNISLLGPDSLKVEGCVGALCGGETWSRSTK
jgi:uncharacterized protein (DUF2147 family)